MTRPRTIARPVLLRMCLALLVGLAGLIPATGQLPCPPTALQMAGDTSGGKVRPVPVIALQNRSPAVIPRQGPLLNQAPPGLTRPDGVTPRSAPTDPPVPCVAVRVRVPAEVASGQELTYQITAVNISRADAHHVTVRVPTPSNAKVVRATPPSTENGPVLVWKLGTLRAAEKREIRLIITPTGDGEVACCARVQYEHGQCVRTRLTRPGLQVKVSGKSEAAKYDILKFKIEVSNTGRVLARNVAIEQALPRGLDFINSKPSTTGDNPLVWKIGDLEAGRSRTVEYDVTASGLGEWKSTAVITADGGVRRESSHVVKVGEPALSVLVTGPQHRLVDRPATYHLTVSNTGTLPATNVDLSDDLPGEIEFLRATAGGRLNGEYARWSIGRLSPGEKKTVQVTVRAKKAGTFKNVVTVTADRGLSEQAKMHTKFETADGLALEIEKEHDPVALGAVAMLALRLFNRGQANETGVATIVRLPEGLTALEVKGVPKAEIKDGLIRLPVLKDLSPGKEQIAVIRLKAEKAGEYKVEAECISDRTGPGKGVKIEETILVGEQTKRTSLRPKGKGLERAEFIP